MSYGAIRRRLAFTLATHLSWDKKFFFYIFYLSPFLRFALSLSLLTSNDYFSKSLYKYVSFSSFLLTFNVQSFVFLLCLCISSFSILILFHSLPLLWFLLFTFSSFLHSSLLIWVFPDNVYFSKSLCYYVFSSFLLTLNV